MIRNIVFDLGNVLLSFRPAEFLEKKKYPQALKEQILADVFGSREWLMIDNGDISTEDAIEAIAGNSLLKREEIVRIFDLRREILFPLDDNIKVLPELRKRGYRLYFLSNFPPDIWPEVRKYEFFYHFEGGLISGDAGASKPHRPIYEMLITKFGIEPRECLYIDDLEPNVETAVSLGMKGITTYGSLKIDRMIDEALSESD
ncbi:MAG: HAD family hydrolase [Methanosarcina sp.]